MSRNAGVFWAMLQCNLLVGNTIAYYQFQGLDSIDKDTRVTTVGIFFGCALAGCLIFLFLLPGEKHSSTTAKCRMFEDTSLNLLSI